MVSSVVRLVGTLLASRWLSTLVCSQGQDPFSHTSGHQVIFDEELQTCSPVASPNFSPKWPWSWVDVAFLHLLDDFFVCNPAKFLLECHQPAKPSSLLMNPILASVDLVLFLASVGHITARFTKKKRKIKSTCRFQQPSLLSKMFSIAAHMCMNKMTKLTTSFSLKKKKKSKNVCNILQ